VLRATQKPRRISLSLQLQIVGTGVGKTCR